ncbi:tyrosine-type recombinase/integrase [Actinomadura rugatobispora]|uniref:Tyrosine-type recombinase/integrase n=1 Tax=Actinomadura rugatobispora TaxID=1994 RepID=A0ABW0ZRF0_9ACTN
MELLDEAVDALRKRHARQAAQRLKADQAWKGTGLVFCSRTGTPLDPAHVRRGFRLITKNAKIGENWTPRELRHSFVSSMSDSGVPLETIADLVGHAGTAVTRRCTGTS